MVLNQFAFVAASGTATTSGRTNATARVMEPSAMQHRNPACDLGSGRIPGEYELAKTDPELVRATVSALTQPA